MNTHELLRVFALCIVLAGAETLHGIARAALLVPRIGKAQAVKISAVSGTLLAFVICYFLVPGIGLSGIAAHLALGLVIAGFMATFDIFIGKAVMRLPWARIRRDFNPASGNYLAFGLAALVLVPALVWWLRGPPG